MTALNSNPAHRTSHISMGLGPAFDAQFCAAGGGGGSCWMAAQDDSNRVVILENGLVVYTSPPDAAGITAVAMAASHCSQGMLLYTQYDL